MSLVSRLTSVPTARRGDGESGAALVVVVAVGAVLAMFMSILVVTAVNGTKQAHSDADWNAALAAAYAGIDEYQSRLSDDTSYYRFGNAASSFSVGSTVSAPLTPNPAFDVGPGGGWGTVPGTSSRAQFRYEVDNSKYATSGRIRLRATGKVGQATRTVLADLKQQGFIDFLYFTDYEVQDPSVAGTSNSTCFSDPLTKTTLKYSWSGRPTGSTCNEISFGPLDVTDGPVHTNDTLRACGARFKSTVTTARATSPFYLNRDSNYSTCAAAVFELSGYPSFSGGVIGMPATNSQLKKETRTDLPADVPRPGCLYTGPTQFTFFANGTVNIKSPFSKKTRIGNAAATAGSTPAECGAIADLSAPAGATIAIPENNVLYVQNVPAVTNDVNYWASGTNPSGFTCITSPESAGKRGWTLGSGAAKSGYPVNTGTTSTTEIAPSGTTYGCRSGDVFVKGSFNGAATLAAENYVFVVGDIDYVDENEDILGLVGNNAIWVWNPLNSSGNNILADHRTIEAAVLSVAHTFQVQNYNDGGSQGTLTVMGAIAQKFRGVVATTSGGSIATGYAKNYVYDERFKFKAPPKFLNPITTTYGVTTWVETAAVWAADGSAR